MRGHHELIEMRKQGKAPRYVFINDYHCRTDWFENPGDAVTICTEGDDVKTLDMRFLVGLTVLVSSGSEKRARGLLDACKRYAGVVAAHHIVNERQYWNQTGWFEVWRREAVQ